MKKWSKFVENVTSVTYVVGVVACLNNDREFLIVKRSSTDPVKPGYWEWPGGHTDKEDNSIEDAAARELEEEANVHVDASSLKFLGYEEETRNSVENPNIQVNVQKHYFLALKWEKEAKIVQNPHSGIWEHDDLKWATKEEIGSIDNSTIPNYLLTKALKIAGFETKND